MVKRAGGALLLDLKIDPRAPKSMGSQLYAAMRETILSGGVAPGVRLPATRTLADELGVSRTTVIDAFERLLAEGLIVSHTGSGSYVSEALRSERPQPPSRIGRTAVRQREPQISRSMGWAFAHFLRRERLPHRPRAFVTALPAFDAFPMAQWARIASRHWRGPREQTLGYGEAEGHAGLREAIATHLRGNRGITCDKEQIFIVGGAQQAFWLIGTMLLNPGDRVWFENPGAIGARNGLVACGADLVPVPVDADGLRVDEAMRLSPKFRLAFVTPSHQQPLGHVMSLERRFALLQAAEKAGAWIIEDDYDGEFFFGRRPPPTLKSVDRTGLVIYVGTFSKSLFPALRLGFVVVPPDLVDVFARVARSFVPGVPTSIQATVAEFIDEGHFATHVRRMRAIYAERHAALVEGAKRKLGSLLEIVPADSGLHTIGRLAAGISEASAAEEAAARDVIVSPLARYSIGPAQANGLVLGFAAVNPREIGEGVTRLAAALEPLAKRGRRRMV
ncbi:MAG: PLP-dependent aminotransferase family protein [Proteobacteria bacterium]|nr:PLP-dependent aminotransferase family protein [Pseudomonadota bacterium]